MPTFEETMTQNFTKIDADYLEFAKAKSKCRLCEIYDCYKQNAQSEGCAVSPTFMFIGEAFGKDELEQVRPFCGRAGQRLRAEVRKHSNVFNKENTIMTNVLSCRPKDNTFPAVNNKSYYTHWHDNTRNGSNRSTADIAKFCQEKWLSKEIELLKPKVIVTLGAVPLRYVCGKSSISESRGEWMFLSKVQAWALPTYHPSYVLRCANDPQKSYVVNLFEQDIKKVATTWATVVSNDYRMKMKPDDYRRMKALTVVKQIMP